MNIFLLIVSAIASCVFGAISVGGLIVNIVSDPKWHKPIPAAIIIFNALIAAISFGVFAFAHFLGTSVHIK